MPEDIVLQEIGGRIFRKHQVIHTKSPSSVLDVSKLKLRGAEYDDDRECVGDYTVEKDEKSSTFRIKFTLPKIFYKYIVGRAGNIKNKIQNDTGASISIPTIDNSSEEIVVKGPSEGSVISAKTRLDLIVENALYDLPFTHFLSIPLNDAILQQHLKTLQSDILIRCNDAHGLEKSILIDPAQFHLTILMLKLYTPESINKAQKLLKECAPQIYDIVGTRSVVAHLQGLEYMNDDPSAVDILYVKVGGSKRLADICSHLVNVYSAANLCPPQESTKLHATLISTKLRSMHDVKRDKARQAIDATPIIHVFGDVDLGSYRLTDVHLSQRGAFDPSSDYWKCVATISLP